MAIPLFSFRSPLQTEQRIDFNKGRIASLKAIEPAAMQMASQGMRPGPNLRNLLGLQSAGPQPAPGPQPALGQGSGGGQNPFIGSLPGQNILGPQPDLGNIAAGFAPEPQFGPQQPGAEQQRLALGGQAARRFAGSITPEQGPAIRLLGQVLEETGATAADYTQAREVVGNEISFGPNVPPGVQRGMEALKLVADTLDMDVLDVAKPGTTERIGQREAEVPEGFQRERPTTNRAFPDSLAAQQDEIDAQRRAQELGIPIELAGQIRKEDPERPTDALLEGPLRIAGFGAGTVVGAPLEGLRRAGVPGLPKLSTSQQVGEELGGELGRDEALVFSLIPIPFIDAPMAKLLGLPFKLATRGGRAATRAEIKTAIETGQRFLQRGDDPAVRESVEALTQTIGPRPGERPLAQLAETERRIAASTPQGQIAERVERAGVQERRILERRGELQPPQAAVPEQAAAPPVAPTRAPVEPADDVLPRSVIEEAGPEELELARSAAPTREVRQPAPVRGTDEFSQRSSTASDELTAFVNDKTQPLAARREAKRLLDKVCV